jgi:hypothetical protein
MPLAVEQEDDLMEELDHRKTASVTNGAVPYLR